MVLQGLLQSGSSALERATRYAEKNPLVVALVVLPAVYTLVKSKARKRAKYVQYPSPPSTLPILGNTLDSVKNRPRFHDWIYSLCKHFKGKPFLLRTIGRPDLIMLTNPEQWEDVLKTHFDNFPKGPYKFEMLEDLFGRGIFATDGEVWARQRKTASNLFTARSLRESMSKTIRKYTHILIRVLDKASASGATIDLFKILNQFTMEAFAEIGFGIEMNGLETEKEHEFQQSFDRALAALMLRIVRPAWLWRLERWLNIGSERQLKEDVKVIDKTMLDIIAQSFEKWQKRTSDGDTTDLVSLFLDQNGKSRDAKEAVFDTRDLRDLLANFLLAGRDTTAQSLSWFLLNMSRHPEVADKIRAEIKHVIPELMDGSLQTPTAEQVQQLTYLEAALKESLRLYPIVAFQSRHAMEDVVLRDGTFIPKDTHVGMPSYSMGRMEHVWGPDATEYKPERWIDPETTKLIAVSAFKFTAFHSGPRICLGMNLAMLEMKIVAASLLSRMDIEILNEDQITYDFSITLPIRGEMLATVKTLAN
ncbi:hypothetical protein Poli38472_005332 [Pythium oligandrum]|uniref:Cytochrome P450 n=1 Tax=Pythium oligandrum TaxID=41045 RepID=A0A8K1FJ38_PYTOL|nr:hypothetical protein Poli38472_005332 [Pythium oligandrum]|eukprot:TMW62714.1 hypothetical protein Poli38472_005332 [Pythium oligandrum]